MNSICLRRRRQYLSVSLPRQTLSRAVDAGFGLTGYFGPLALRWRRVPDADMPATFSLRMCSAIMKRAETRELYRSPNGDTWFLVRDRASGPAFIRHQANTSAGG